MAFCSLDLVLLNEIGYCHMTLLTLTFHITVKQRQYPFRERVHLATPPQSEGAEGVDGPH